MYDKIFCEEVIKALSYFVTKCGLQKYLNSLVGVILDIFHYQKRKKKPLLSDQVYMNF